VTIGPISAGESPSRGLIEQQKPRLQRHRHGDFELALVAIGEVAHLGVALVPQADVAQGVGG
jgi:hypothetical protein